MVLSFILPPPKWIFRCRPHPSRMRLPNAYFLHWNPIAIFRFMIAYVHLKNNICAAGCRNAFAETCQLYFSYPLAYGESIVRIPPTFPKKNISRMSNYTASDKITDRIIISYITTDGDCLFFDMTSILTSLYSGIEVIQTFYDEAKRNFSV